MHCDKKYAFLVAKRHLQENGQNYLHPRTQTQRYMLTLKGEYFQCRSQRCLRQRRKERGKHRIIWFGFAGACMENEILNSKGNDLAETFTVWAISFDFLLEFIYTNFEFEKNEFHLRWLYDQRVIQVLIAFWSVFFESFFDFCIQTLYILILFQ